MEMDFMKICRACTSEKTNLLNLFANDCDDEPTLGEKFLICTSLDLQEADDYPQHICYSCAKQLETAYKFRKQCERSFKQFEKKHAAFSKVCQTNIKIEPKVENDEQMDTICLDDITEEESPNPNAFDTGEVQEESYESLEQEENVAEISEHEESSPEIVNEIPDAGLNKTPDISVKKVVDINISVEERNHQCNECEKSFFTLRALELHLRLNHKLKLNIAPIQLDNFQKTEKQSQSHVCKICDANLKNVDDLRMHRILEHGRRILTCAVCDKAFRDRVAYKKHLLEHYRGDGYPCQICGKEYSDARYLQRHMLYHQIAQFRCEEPACGKSFKVKHKLVEHIRLYHNRHITSEEVRQIQPI